MKGLGVKIIGIGSFLPGEPVSNEELSARLNLDFNVEMVRHKVGIHTRHIASDEIATSHIAAGAAKIALLRAGITAQDLDRILLGTSTPDYTNTAASCSVQFLLGANCPVGDTSASCAGFIYALDHGIRLIQTGLKYVCVIGADTKTRFVRKDDPVFCPIFGDGGGAVILAACDDDAGFMVSELFADGSGLKNIYVPAGGSVMPASIETVTNGLHGTVMTVSGKKMVEISINLMADIALKACSKYGIHPNAVDIFIPHQANMIIMKGTAQKLGIDISKMEITIDKAANSIAGTLPITFDHAFTTGKLTSGKIVLFVTAASGYAGGAAIYKVP
ncbi:MAG: 3-oxoacyl-ACP synthase III family protein [Chitinophagales bacterium]